MTYRSILELYLSLESDVSSKLLYIRKGIWFTVSSVMSICSCQLVAILLPLSVTLTWEKKFMKSPLATSLTLSVETKAMIVQSLNMTLQAPVPLRTVQRPFQ